MAEMNRNQTQQPGNKPQQPRKQWDGTERRMGTDRRQHPDTARQSGNRMNEGMSR